MTCSGQKIHFEVTFESLCGSRPKSLFSHFGATLKAPEGASLRRELRGNRIGATGLRASERKSASERVSEREGFQRFLRGFERFLEVLRGFQRF